MISLNKLKQKRDNRESKNARKTAYLRITKDINDLNLPKTCKIEFPDPDDLAHFKLAISPDEGFYRHFKIRFDFQLSSDYPYEPPKVKCETEIYHPNIDLDGNVCLNILRQDWKPVLSINSIVYGLQYLLLEPNPGDALNETAANQLKYDKMGFAKNVEKVGTGFLSARSITEMF